MNRDELLVKVSEFAIDCIRLGVAKLTTVEICGHESPKEQSLYAFKAAPEDGFRYGLNSWEYVMINTNRQKSPDPDPIVLFVSYNNGATYKRVYSTGYLKDEQLLADVADCKKNFLPYFINVDGEYYEGQDGYVA